MVWMNRPPQVVVDQDLLYQAFLNILLNAIQAMPHSGRPDRVRHPRPYGQGGEIRFQVDGEGIDPEALNKIPSTPFSPPRKKAAAWDCPS